MPTFEIQNWKYGLDSRRSVLTSEPGTLVVGINVHINQGAEIEKRKAFVDLGTFGNTVPSIEVTANGLMTFGSVVPGSQTVPTGGAAVAYTQILHPTDSTVTLTSVLCSCNFGGKVWCACQFSDSSVFCFYDGVVIPASIAGQVFNASYAAGTLTGDPSNVVDGDTVTIDVLTYRFKNTLAQAYDVKIGSSKFASMTNLVEAINGTGVAGTNWYGTGAGGTSGSINSPLVFAQAFGLNSITVLASNTFSFTSIAVGTTSYHLNWGATTLPVATQVQTSAQIAAQMFNILSGENFTNAGIFVENLNGASFNIYSSYGITWEPTIDVNSDAGTLVTALLSNGVEPVAGGSTGADLTLYAGHTGILSSLKATASNITGSPFSLLTATMTFDTLTPVKNAAAFMSGVQSLINTGLTNLPLTATQTTNSLAISTTASINSSYLTYAVTNYGATAADLCFENFSYDFSGVTDATITNLFVTNGSNLVPTGAAYVNQGVNGIVYGIKSGSLVTGAYYVWLPGTADTALSINSGSTKYLASNYPNGVVFQALAGKNVDLYGKPAGAAVTARIYALTDILHTAMTLGGGSGGHPSAAQVQAIATQILANNNGYVASTYAAGGTVTTTTLFISRKNLSLTASAYNNFYYYCSATGISPAGVTAPQAPLVYGFSQSTAAVNGRGSTYEVTFGGTWLEGDSYVFDIVTDAVGSAPGSTFVCGTGNLTGLIPVACLTLSDRVHFVAGPYWLGSDNNDPTAWEEQAVGAFKIDASKWFQGADTLLALAEYQGRIALFANYMIQIWILDANPQNITQQQNLSNTGTYCSLGPQSIGDLDVVYPSITGFRSLRVRDSSLNAFVNDLGSPIDLIMQNAFVMAGLGNLGSSCSIVEPSANRYWHFLNGVVYVLTYFPAAKINAAWSEYEPCYYVAGVKKTFTAVKAVIFNSQVYVLAYDSVGTYHFFLYGGTTNNSYDQSLATATTPWLDMGEAGIRKQLESIDVAMTGAWQFYAGMDYADYVANGNPIQAVVNAAISTPTFQYGSFGVTDEGFHLQLSAICSTASYAVLSSFTVHFQKCEEK